ncbi:DNA-binding response regulator [Hypericibacter terrae]|jgi:two-component system KDP operon response regulator KdpE|uniref:DNA-binding response regulator n=1 Tax=Hypericibacter terrae TaxID=2602015 RepID=A0A5J6MCP6_9PROT|nr:response regulator transcription factor [Hypericibacter terrae]QEX15103.1 DNA-binding response regulator [Hypericibacter terrae]
MTSDRATVLVIDDEPPIRRLLRTTLTAQDYRVIEAADGQEGLNLLRHEKPDVLVVDLGLPDIDGLELIRMIRAESPVPIVVLSSRDDEKSKVEALDLGADDYVTKPFGMEELVARLRTALRHRLQQQGGRPTFRSGDLTVDLVRRIVTVRGEEVKLSPKEYDLLQQFVVHAGKVLTHRHLLREVWKDENGGDVQYLRVYVRQLRQKIETDPERPALILTEPGVGYRLQV